MENCKFSKNEPCHPIKCLMSSQSTLEIARNQTCEDEPDYKEELLGILNTVGQIRNCAVSKVNALKTFREIEPAG